MLDDGKLKNEMINYINYIHITLISSITRETMIILHLLNQHQYISF